MQKKRTVILLFLAAILALYGCSAESQTLSTVDGLDTLGNVQVISREEGSGTRSAFAELVGFDESTDDSIDATTENAQIVTNTESVISAVAGNASAIGYLSMGALDNLNEEKVLIIDGVSATTENVADGTYPLSRPFCLAWSGKLSELEQDFRTYVLGKGQEIVSESYVAVDDSTTFLSGKQSGTISIQGSTSAAPLLEELAAEYMELNPNATVTVSATDSTTGLNKAMQGKCDFAISSRDLKDYEKELLDYDVIAQDGIAVIVNKNNPLEEVTTDELNALFTGSIAKWDSINTERED